MFEVNTVRLAMRKQLSGSSPKKKMSN